MNVQVWQITPAVARMATSSTTEEERVNTDKDCGAVSPVYAAIDFRTSSFCNSGGCVEVALLPTGEVAVRDSKAPGTSTLRYSAREWTDFVAGVKNGEFDFS